MKTAFFLLTVLVHAQTYEVRGILTEAGGGGIADVEVTVQRIEDGAAKKTRTDGQGAYRVTLDAPGVYIAMAVKDGYFGAGLGMQPVSLTAAQPQGVSNLTFTRAGEVSGRVIDEETREPVAGLQITLFPKQWNFGQLSLYAATREPAMTDEEGRFRFPNLRPGIYVASARSQTPATARIMRDYSPADAEMTDEAFQPTYWPGGGDAASAFGVTLTSGGYADVGTMLVRKAPQYRVQVTTQADCPEGDALRISILRRNGGAAATVSDLPCSGKLLLRGFDPDSYALYAATERRSGITTALSGVASFAVVNKNLQAAISLQSNIVIEGQLVVAEGSAAPRLLPRIASRPFELLPGTRLDNDDALQWAPDQRHFQLAVSPRTQTLNVSDPADTYVKEIRYNGTPLHGTTLPINTSSAAHKLEIIVDDKWGSLAATVTDGSRGVAAGVLITKDGARVEDLRDTPTSVRSASVNGTLASVRLAPGDYRIIAFTPEAAQRIHEPDILRRALAAAQRITVAPGAAQTIPLRVSDLR